MSQNYLELIPEEVLNLIALNCDYRSIVSLWRSNFIGRDKLDQVIAEVFAGHTWVEVVAYQLDDFLNSESMGFTKRRLTGCTRAKDPSEFSIGCSTLDERPSLVDRFGELAVSSEVSLRHYFLRDCTEALDFRQASTIQGVQALLNNPSAGFFFAALRDFWDGTPSSWQQPLTELILNQTLIPPALLWMSNKIRSDFFTCLVIQDPQAFQSRWSWFSVESLLDLVLQSKNLTTIKVFLDAHTKELDWSKTETWKAVANSKNSGRFILAKTFDYLVRQYEELLAPQSWPLELAWQRVFLTASRLLTACLIKRIDSKGMAQETLQCLAQERDPSKAFPMILGQLWHCPWVDRQELINLLPSKVSEGLAKEIGGTVTLSEVIGLIDWTKLRSDLALRWTIVADLATYKLILPHLPVEVLHTFLSDLLKKSFPLSSAHYIPRLVGLFKRRSDVLPSFRFDGLINKGYTKLLVASPLACYFMDQLVVSFRDANTKELKKLMASLIKHPEVAYPKDLLLKIVADGEYQDELQEELAALHLFPA